jgi:uncharacterized protein involved in exopolysaccharide biosynthesis
LWALRGRWQIAPALAVLGLLAAAAYVLGVPKVYTATASVRPAAAPGAGAIAGTFLLPVWVLGPGGDAQAAGSAGAAKIAGQMLHGSLSPLAARNEVSVSVAPGSGVVDISCTASSASGAAACANAFAAAYLNDRGASSKAAIDQHIAPLNSQINSLQKTVSGLKAKIISLPSHSAERPADQTRLASAQRQLSSLNTELLPLYAERAGLVNGGTVVTAASPTRGSAGPGKTLVLAGGLAAGLLLGLIAEFWIDRRDKRIWSAVVR